MKIINLNQRRKRILKLISLLLFFLLLPITIYFLTTENLDDRGEASTIQPKCFIPYANRMYGDVTNNNNIAVADAISILRHIVELETLDEKSMIAADVNGNNEVDINDAILILRYIVGTINYFPKCIEVDKDKFPISEEDLNIPDSLEDKPKEVPIFIDINTDNIKKEENTASATVFGEGKVQIFYHNPLKIGLEGGEIKINFKNISIKQNSLKVELCHEQNKIALDNLRANSWVIIVATVSDFCREIKYPFIEFDVRTIRDDYEISVNFEETILYPVSMGKDKDKYEIKLEPYLKCDRNANPQNPNKGCPEGNICIDKTCYKGDINNDGEITFEDASIFLQDIRNYFNNNIYNPRSDLNNDNKINFTDFAILKETWIASRELSYIENWGQN